MFGEKTINQKEFPAIYEQVRKVALTPSNIKKGFEAAGLYPLMTGEEWINKYRTKYNIKKNTEFSEATIGRGLLDMLKPSKKIEGLNLSNYDTKTLAPTALRIPKTDKKKSTRSKINEIDELKSEAKANANDPKRTRKMRVYRLGLETLKENRAIQKEEKRKKRIERETKQQARLEIKQRLQQLVQFYKKSGHLKQNDEKMLVPTARKIIRDIKGKDEAKKVDKDTYIKMLETAKAEIMYTAI